MAVGDLITYDNYKAMVPEVWRIEQSWSEPNGKTIYISSCSFIVQIEASSVLFRNARIAFNAYYYNGSAWVYAYSGSATVQGINSKTLQFFHNREAEGSTDADQHQHHLWKYVMESTSSGSAWTKLKIWLGGLETMTVNEYDTYFYGHLLMGVKCEYNDGTTDTAFVASNYPSVYKGTPVSISSGTYKYLCYEKNYLN